MSRTVLVVGSVNIDDAVRVPRFPGPGETLTARGLDTALGGKGANQAVAAARAGAAVRMVGAVGSGDGASLVAALDAEGIEVTGLTRLDGTPTGRAIVLIDDAAENSIVVLPGANHAIPEAAVHDACARLGEGDVLLLQNEIPAALSRLAAELARDAGAAVVWNAAPAPDELVPADLLVVNEHELRRLAELHGIGSRSADSLVIDLAEAANADVICTVGPAGAVYRVAGETGSAAAREVDAVDTTAAGDTFAGYFAALADLPLRERLRHALDAASLAVTRPGASPSIPRRAEVDALSEMSAPIPGARSADEPDAASLAVTRPGASPSIPRRAEVDALSEMSAPIPGARSAGEPDAALLAVTRPGASPSVPHRGEASALNTDPSSGEADPAPQRGEIDTHAASIPPSTTDPCRVAAPTTERNTAA